MNCAINLRILATALVNFVFFVVIDTSDSFPVIGHTWRSALKRADLSWVPVYQSMKHAQISALRRAGLPVDDIVEQCRWTSPDMLERYDPEQDLRRDKVANLLESLVDDARG